MIWRVIVEPPAGAPYIAATSRSHREASALVFKVAEALRHHKGTRVLIQSDDSRDQLQVSQRGRVVRDQPHLPAVGEHKIIRVPLARATLRTGQ